ncbi:unnamed protein product [Rotaria sp. Silwood1]|nr:unnamed protein product [Rotaria sp. Silwood1]CAF1551271.1 unnamed protein product [Rotaria sp. Silwood1]CAF1551469.1 unnamed protein product [Rotaria sp. Silwood1]CAF3629654.1 unnamed protein product [Rotaria sp. Silwood1]CAF3661293.1 unnamed protein product [Rotaria sp. Silwood1]
MEDLNDEQRALIPNPLGELTLHCINKGFQLGSTVTMATILPYQLYKSRKNLSFISTLNRVGTATIYASIIGAGLSLGLMQAKLYSEKYNQYKIWDRAYRLRHSKSQQRVDKYVFTYSMAGGLAGLIIGLPTKFHPLSVIKGAFMAIPLGIITHLIKGPTEN